MNDATLIEPTGLLPDAEALKAEILRKLTYSVGKDTIVARPYDWLSAAILVVRDRVIDRWQASTRAAYKDSSKRVYYLSLEFRFHVSMCGSLGVGGHLLHWSEDDRAAAATWIGLYKEIRPIIQFGDQYRLHSPQEHSFSAVQYVSKDRSQAVLFAFRTYLPFPTDLPPLYLRGLVPEAHYEIEGIAGARSGLAWMRAGLEIEMGDFQSTVRRIRRV